MIQMTSIDIEQSLLVSDLELGAEISRIAEHYKSKLVVVTRSSVRIRLTNYEVVGARGSIGGNLDLNPAEVKIKAGGKGNS